jgi:nudix-type nucleoside diphosphatase (YffH/AdpP family)
MELERNGDQLAVGERVRVKSVTVLAHDWHLLKKTVLDYRRTDGSWSSLSRETYDRGNGATILLYDRTRGTVVLVRQFRYPAFVNNHDGMLIETPAGLLDGKDAEAAIRREAEEETGFCIGEVRKAFEVFMSPGSVTERVAFFVAEYVSEDRVSEGGGLVSDGEDIEVLEIAFEDALNMVKTGEIMDGKTIMLLQYAQLEGLFDTPLGEAA